ncbi:MAG TPA: hypothetical protein VFG02_05000 [Nitrospirota bacterium]|nr:hypothetical protein [Nitrospirota bacterium]
MERYRDDNRALLRLIFNASFASLSYEIALMRTFSISLWYHFAFMVISIAMLGIGASGTALSIFPSLKDIRKVPRYALMLAVSIPASYLLANAVPFDPARLSWDRIQILFISLYYVILCIPFFCFGLIVSIAYSTMSREATAIYASDLLGAGAGAIAMVWLLSLGGPEASVFIISSLLATGLLYQVDRKTRTVSALLFFLNMAVLFMQPAFIQPRISPYKPFAFALQFPGAERISTAYSPYSRVDLFKSPAIRFAPGLSFAYLEPLPEQTGVAVDAGDIYAMTNDTDDSRLSFIRSLPSSLAYLLGSNNDVLIIEPRAGLALLTARQFGARTISAVDSNPLVIRAVREYGREHASSIYEENTWSGLGRTWLAATDREFDLIDLSFMGSLPSATFGFAEDYRFTVEAFEQYLAHLKREGFLSLNLYIIPPPRSELRLLATLARSAEASGIRDISRHIVAIRSWDTLTMVMKRSALIPEDIRRIKAFAREKRFDLMYYPGIRPEESNVHIKMPGNEYAEAFQRLVSKETRDRFMADYLFDIQPVPDERPFFHYYLKLKNIKAIYRVMGEKWQYFIEEGYLLPVLFVQVLVVSLILILLPLLTLKRTVAGNNVHNSLRSLSYFALLGIGYLFLEIAFIQKMILSLENPAYAASTVIASVLICSGIGSLLSRRFRTLKSPRVLLILAALAVVYSIMLPGTTASMSHHPLLVKIVLAFVILMPAGILLGIPFPLGISVLGSTAPRLIPWAWAVNGCFSVLSPVLAVMLALSAGYQTVLITGAAMYLIAFWAIRWGLNVVAEK